MDIVFFINWGRTICGYVLLVCLAGIFFKEILGKTHDKKSRYWIGIYISMPLALVLMEVVLRNDNVNWNPRYTQNAILRIISAGVFCIEIVFLVRFYKCMVKLCKTLVPEDKFIPTDTPLTDRCILLFAIALFFIFAGAGIALF